jgi:hypothetical protein
MGLSIETAKKLKIHRSFMLYPESEPTAQYFTPCDYWQLQLLLHLQSKHCHKSLCNSDVICSMVHSPVQKASW